MAQITREEALAKWNARITELLIPSRRGLTYTLPTMSPPASRAHWHRLVRRRIAWGWVAWWIGASSSLALTLYELERGFH